MFRRLYDEVRNGNDCHTSGKKDPGVGLRPKVLKRDRNRNKNEQPVDCHHRFLREWIDCVTSAAVIFGARRYLRVLRNAAAPLRSPRTDSSCSEFPPSAEQIIAKGWGLPAVPFLEPARRREYSLPIVAAQQHRLVLKATRAELHAGIVGNGGEVRDRAEVGQTNLSVGQIQIADPPILQPLPAGHHLGGDELGSSRQYAVLQPTELFASVDDAERWLNRRRLEAAQVLKIFDLFQLEKLIVGWIIRRTLDTDQDFRTHGAANAALKPASAHHAKVFRREVGPLAQHDAAKGFDRRNDSIHCHIGQRLHSGLARRKKRRACRWRLAAWLAPAGGGG